MEAKYEGIRKRLTEQIDALQERNTEIELSLKAQVDDAVTEATTLREQLATSEEVKTKALDQVRQLESQKARMMEESEDRAKIRYLELERELDEKTQDFEETLRDMQSKSEEQLAQLKTFFEIERDRLERRLQEERERA
jgi:t-SNARE complex subunit (syntaxin)